MKDVIIFRQACDVVVALVFICFVQFVVKKVVFCKIEVFVVVVVVGCIVEKQLVAMFSVGIEVNFVYEVLIVSIVGINEGVLESFECLGDGKWISWFVVCLLKSVYIFWICIKLFSSVKDWQVYFGMVFDGY